MTTPEKPKFKTTTEQWIIIIGMLIIWTVLLHQLLTS